MDTCAAWLAHPKCYGFSLSDINTLTLDDMIYWMKQAAYIAEQIKK